jgi:hypothetical protein
MIVGSFDYMATETAHDHEVAPWGADRGTRGLGRIAGAVGIPAHSCDQ